MDEVKKKRERDCVILTLIIVLFSLLSTHDDLTMQALVWLCVVLFRVTWFGASYMSLR